MKIYEHLKSKGVGTMMWADMLIHSQNCRGQDNCRGSIAGIHTVLPAQDIVLVDALQAEDLDYPSMDYLLSDSVLGCTVETLSQQLQQVRGGNKRQGRGHGPRLVGLVQVQRARHTHHAQEDGVARSRGLLARWNSCGGPDKPVHA
jgi:hypothetical protein